MNVRLSDTGFTLFILQRLSGALLALLLFAHLVTIIFAVQGGLSVAEIVDRVRGNLFWVSFYGVFALTAVVHAMIGLRKILIEWTPVNPRVVDVVVSLYVIGALWLGYEAIEAIW